MIIDKNARTEVSTVVLYNNGNKASIVNKIPTLDPRLLDFTFLEKTKALHIGGYLLLPNLWGNSIRRLLRRATREDVVISVDPQMSATGQWNKAFRGLFEQLDILLLDEVEAIRISKKKRIIDAIECLQKNGVEIVAVKTGRKGCIVGGNGRLYTVKALRSKIVSTIGAGDAFDAAFIYGDSS
jgi:sugar/nucleoside kinase (ribokinase family)